MQKISLRKYAAIVGVSHTAVAKAVKAGHIVKGWDTVAKKIIVEEANKEWGNNANQKSTNNAQGNAKELTDISFTKSLTTGQDYNQTGESISFQEARRRKEVYNAELSRILALKEQGVYVEKQKVYSQLFDFAKQLRNSLQTIPDRIIDNLIASKTRHEAHSLLLNAINESLEVITKPPDL